MLDINKIYTMNCIDGMKLLENATIDLIVTDPPYSLNYEFENDKLSQDEQYKFMKEYTAEFFRILKDGGTVCIFMEQKMTHYLYFALKKNGFTWQNEVIWNRDGGQMPTKKLGACHEMVNIWTKGNDHRVFNLDDIRVKSKYAETDKRLNPKGKNPGDVWYVPALFGKKAERILGDDGKALHPTQKPVDIIIPLIEAYSNEGDVVLDAFNGTGTTSYIAQKMNRNFIAFETDQKYVNAAYDRLLQ